MKSGSGADVGPVDEGSAWAADSWGDDGALDQDGDERADGGEFTEVRRQTELWGPSSAAFF